jgi:protocatechuate 3,4-dioxygenase beta subunit
MKRIGFAIGIVVLGAMLWWTWSRDLAIEPIAPASDRVEPEPPPPPPAPATAAVPAPVRASSQDGAWWAHGLLAPEALLQEAAEDDARAGVLRGRLTVKQQPWQHPASVEVRLTRSWLDSVVPVETTPEAAVPQRDELRTTTDAQGFFAFRLVPPATELFFLIGHGTEWNDFQKVSKLPHAAEAIDLGDVFVDQRGEISGRVVMHGRPVAGADLRAVDDPLLDGTSGFEEIAMSRLADLEEFRTKGATADGPVPAWVVQRDHFLPFPRATTGPDGRFRLRGVRPGNHDVIVQTEMFHGRSAGVLVAAGRATEIGDVTPVGDGWTALTFVDEQEKPWKGALIVSVQEPSGFGGEPLRTDERGEVLVPVAGSRARIYFAPGPGGPWQYAHTTEPPDPGRSLTDWQQRIVVKRASEFVVVLSDERGGAIAGGTVRTYTQTQTYRPEDRALPGSMQPREREPGRYVGTTLGPVVVVASAPGFAPAMARAIAGAPVTMTMLPLQSITVHVHDLRNHPVAGATVRAQVHANDTLRFPGAQWDALANDRVLIGRTDEHGDLEAPVWPTWFSFQASHRDFAPSAAPKVMPVPGQRLDLLLLGGGEVRGTLTIASRAAPAGLRVRARQRPPEDSPLAKSGYLDERLAVTGAGGTFALRQLVAGFWDLEPELPVAPTASEPRRLKQPWNGQRVYLDEGQELHVVLEIQGDWRAAAQVQGTVTSNGAVVAGALVRIRELDPAGARARNATRRMARTRGDDQILRALGPDEVTQWSRCETDAFGEFSFRELAAGVDHELRVDVPAGGRLQFIGRRVVRPGPVSQPLRLDFALQASDVRITCVKDGSVFANRMLRLRQVVDKETEGARYELLLDGDGQTWIDQLPVGRWTVEPMHGGRCEPGQFTIEANRPEMFTIAVLAR